MIVLCPALDPDQAAALHLWLCDRLRNAISPAVMAIDHPTFRDAIPEGLRKATEFAARRIEEVLAEVKACGPPLNDSDNLLKISHEVYRSTGSARLADEVLRAGGGG